MDSSSCVSFRFVSFRFVRSCLCFLLHVRLSPLVPLCLSVSPLVLSSVSHRHRYYCRQDDNWHNSPSEEAWPISRKQHAISSLIYATRRDDVRRRLNTSYDWTALWCEMQRVVLAPGAALA